MLRNSPTLLGSLLVLTSALSFATLGTVTNLAYAAGMTPWTFTIVRAIGGASALLGLAWFARSRIGWASLAGLPRRERTALIAAVGANAVLNLALFAAYGTTAIAIAVAGFYTYPFILAIVGAARGEDRIDRVRAAALVIACAGLALVVVGQVDTGTAFSPIGLLLALTASVAQVVFLSISRAGYPSLPSVQAAGVAWPEVRWPRSAEPLSWANSTPRSGRSPRRPPGSPPLSGRSWVLLCRWSACWPACAYSAEPGLGS